MIWWGKLTLSLGFTIKDTDALSDQPYPPDKEGSQSHLEFQMTSEPMLLATFLGVEAKCNGKTLRQESDQRKNSRSMSPERMIWVSSWHSLEMTKGVINLALTAPCAMAMSAASCTLGTLSHDLGLTVRLRQPCG